MWPMLALLTVAVLTAAVEAQDAIETKTGFAQDVEIPPVGWALIFAGSFLFLFIVTIAFRSQNKRH